MAASTPSPVLIPVADQLPAQQLFPAEQLGACCSSLTDAPISVEDAELAAHVFKALADPARVRLLSIIASSGPEGACVCDLNESVDLSQPTVSHHLKVMLDAGLLERERRASWAYYRLRPGVLQTLAGILGA